MDSQSLNQSIELFGSCGFVLSPEKKAALQNSLVILRKNHKFSRVQFWGKIIGVEDDYYIAQGFSEDNVKKTLYSKNCTRWGLLNPPTPENIAKSRLISGPFAGEPSYTCTRQVSQIINGEEESLEISLKEEDRLAAVVSEIDHDVMIVPRGAFIKPPTGAVIQNRMFEGISVSESTQLHSYMHERTAELSRDQSLIERADYERSVDFMDCIQQDVPKGSWSVQVEKAGGHVMIKSLLWVGYHFFHVPNTKLYGSVYIGGGEKNLDLPFMV